LFYSIQRQKSKKANKSQTANKLKRKAIDDPNASKETKKQNKNGVASAPITQDESSSSSSTSAQTSKSSKTAAILAAANSQQAKTSQSKPNDAAPLSDSLASIEEKVRKYLSRKPMSTKELLHKLLPDKSQDKTKNQEVLNGLKVVLEKLNPKMTEKNGVKYLSLL
jgi:transcription initiation factor TFIIF subunit alpha